MSAAPRPDESWSPARWRDRQAAQQPDYAEPAALRMAEAQLAGAPPVVAVADCAALRSATARVAAGDGFILQGGDCAETLGQPQPPVVAGVSALFDRLGRDLPRPLISIARIAGQFAKPRSDARETRGLITLPAYRGDGINGAEFTAAARAPDPARMVAAHAQSVDTARLLAAARSGRPPIFTSHEALLLPYEQALSRRDGEGRWWATSAHMVWIGDRSRQVDGAHVDFASGIENVVGVKCGPSLGADELLRLLDRIERANRPGRIALIGRFGAGAIGRILPPLMAATRREGRRVLWMIDPMHGNGRIEEGRKIRRIDDMLAEARDFVAIAGSEGVRPAGLHLEMTADDIHECVGPGEGSDGRNVSPSLCDPRLNPAQAEMLVRAVASLVSEPA